MEISSLFWIYSFGQNKCTQTIKHDHKTCTVNICGSLIQRKNHADDQNKHNWNLLCYVPMILSARFPAQLTMRDKIGQMRMLKNYSKSNIGRHQHPFRIYWTVPYTISLSSCYNAFVHCSVWQVLLKYMLLVSNLFNLNIYTYRHLSSLNDQRIKDQKIYNNINTNILVPQNPFPGAKDHSQK